MEKGTIESNFKSSRFDAHGWASVCVTVNDYDGSSSGKAVKIPLWFKRERRPVGLDGGIDRALEGREGEIKGHREWLGPLHPYIPELGDGGAGPEVVLDGLGADDPAGGAVLGLVHQLRRVVPVLRLDLRRAVPHVGALDAEALDEHLALIPSLPFSRPLPCSNGMRSEVSERSAREVGGRNEGPPRSFVELCGRGRVSGVGDL